MELQGPSFPVLLTFFVLVFMFPKVVKTYKTNNLKPKLPPGPWKLPIIGNMLHLIGSLPHHCLRDLAKMYGPLMDLQLGEVSNVVVSSAETAKEVMKTHDILFSNRPHLLAPDIMSYGSTGIAFAPYGDYWRYLRKICITELLNSKRVQLFQSIREEEQPLARNAKTKKHLLHYGLRSKLEKIHQKMDKILENIVNEHKVREAMTKTGKGKADDLVDVLLNRLEHGDLEFPLTSNNIKAVILDIFIAGSETSSTTVEWAIPEMLKGPSVMEKA
nr:premnaspirodiene oxygenase [Quercus suber]